MLWYELTRWWSYRRINDPWMPYYVWVLPGSVAVLATAVYYSLPVRPDIAGPDGLLTGLLQIMGLLPGFYIAALAAVATFNRPEMDEAMPEPTPTVRIFRGGHWTDIDLSRRMFLTYLFSYLAVSSLLVSLLCVVLRIVRPGTIALLNMINSVTAHNLLIGLLEIGIVSGLVYLSASILVTTLHGIYFLAERMHQPH